MSAPAVVPRCPGMAKGGRRCGHVLQHEGNFYWCRRSVLDPVTGREGCTRHWPAATVDWWAEHPFPEDSVQA